MPLSRASWAFTAGEAQRPVLPPLADAVNALAVSPCGGTLYVATSTALLAQPLRADTPRTANGSCDAAVGVRDCPLGRRGAACEEDTLAGAPAAARVAAPECYELSRRGYRHVAVAADGARVYGATSFSVSCFAARTLGAARELLRLQDDGSCAVSALALSPDGARLYVGASSGDVRELRTADDADGAPGRPLTLNARGGCSALAVCPRGTRLACLHASGVSLVDVHAATPYVCARLDTLPARLLAWGPHGDSLFLGRSMSVRELTQHPESGAWQPARRCLLPSQMSVMASAALHGTAGARRDLAVGGGTSIFVWHLGRRREEEGAAAAVHTLMPVPEGVAVRKLALHGGGELLYAALHASGGGGGATTVQELRLRPPRRWSRASHAAYPEAFRDAVRALLLALQRVAAARELCWPVAARGAFAEAAAAQLAAQLYGRPYHGSVD